MSQETRNVLLLAGRLTPGGAEVLRSRAARLERRGFGASVVCLGMADRGAGGEPRPDFVECPGLASRWRRPWAVRDLADGDTPPRPDLVHALGDDMAEPALALAERWRVPYVLTIEEFLPPGARLRLSRARFRGLIASGRELAEDLADAAGFPRRAIAVVRPGLEVVRPGVETDAEAVADASREPVSVASRLPVVGTAARLTSGSGLATFLQAARRVLDSGRDAEFLIAGRGPSEEPLRRLADTLHVSDRVTFADDAADYPPFWRVLDVFCLTSLVATTGSTLILALAHGVPSIATDVVGMDGLFADGRVGLVIPPGDPDALALGISELLDDPERARELGSRGRARIAAEFEPEREAGELAAAYRQAIEEKSGFASRTRIYRADARSTSPH